MVGKKKTIKSSIRALHNLGVKMVVITDGTNGSYASDGQAMYYMKVYPIKALARTGAGDAYTSGFLSAILSKLTIKQAMQWGTANASGVVQKVGAQQGILNKRQINQLVKKYKHLSPKAL